MFWVRTHFRIHYSSFKIQILNIEQGIQNNEVESQRDAISVNNIIR